MFTKILVPTDGSKHALRAAEYAADLAKRYGAEVTVLLVKNLNLFPSAAMPSEIHPDILQRMESHYEEVLERTVEVLTRQGMEAATQQVEGTPALMIQSAVINEGFDLIVMGSRGFGPFLDTTPYLGSITERVLHRVSCPVLVVQE